MQVKLYMSCRAPPQTGCAHYFFTFFFVFLIAAALRLACVRRPLYGHVRKSWIEKVSCRLSCCGPIVGPPSTLSNWGCGDRDGSMLPISLTRRAGVRVVLRSRVALPENSVGGVVGRVCPPALPAGWCHVEVPAHGCSKNLKCPEERDKGQRSP